MRHILYTLLGLALVLVSIPHAASAQSKQVAVQDTLRNYTPNLVYSILANDIIAGSTGWVHGFNSFNDVAKATRITLPDNHDTAVLEEVLIFFSYKAPQLSGTYVLNIYAVRPDGSPGDLLGFQEFNYANVNADDNPNNLIFATAHRFNTPINVPKQFFISFNMGPYDDALSGNLTIGSTDLLGRFVAEDWERDANNAWINMSNSWFSGNNNGWNMWIDAVVELNTINNPPQITAHTPVTSVAEGEDITLTAEASGNITSAGIVYIEGGGQTARVVNMTNTSGNTWTGTIPASTIGLRGYQYLISVADNNNVTVQTPAYNGRVTTQGIDRSLGFSGRQEANYRLFSIPIDLNNDNPTSVLQDDLGTYNDEVWRLFGLNADQNYAEFPNSGPMRAGAGFWLASANTASINTGPGQSNDIAATFSIPLNSGWTFIGTPFNFPINQSQLGLSSGASLDIRTFNGTWSTLNGALQPFVGYAVAATASDQLLINPQPASSNKKGGLLAAKKANALDWTINIQASSGDAEDLENTIGVSSSASMQWDDMDRPEPPVIGEYVSLYFPRNWDVPFKHFDTDVRPLDQNNAKWTFEVASSTNKPVSLAFEGVSDVPDHLAVHLVDHMLDTRYDLRNQSSYSFTASDTPVAERFSLVVGPVDELSAQLAADLPQEIELDAYPNPFKTTSNLRIGLVDDSEVTVEVYDVLGKRVARLMANELKSAGYHAVSWDGQNDAGQPVASGIYFYVMQAGAESVTRQIVYMK